MKNTKKKFDKPIFGYRISGLELTKYEKVYNKQKLENPILVGKIDQFPDTFKAFDPLGDLNLLENTVIRVITDYLNFQGEIKIRPSNKPLFKSNQMLLLDFYQKGSNLIYYLDSYFGRCKFFSIYFYDHTSDVIYNFKFRLTMNMIEVKEFEYEEFHLNKKLLAQYIVMGLKANQQEESIESNPIDDLLGEMFSDPNESKKNHNQSSKKKKEYTEEELIDMYKAIDREFQDALNFQQAFVDFMVGIKKFPYKKTLGNIRETATTTTAVCTAVTSVLKLAQILSKSKII